MKDAYSFDADEQGAEKSYMAMYPGLREHFRRCGLRFRAVEADTGEIGGKFSHEFMVLADTGEDVIISCDSCDYAANLERAEVGAAAPARRKRRRVVQARGDAGQEAGGGSGRLPGRAPAKARKDAALYDGQGGWWAPSWRATGR